MSAIEEPTTRLEWQKTFPGKHKVTHFGHARIDGWRCWGCGWRTIEPLRSEEAALRRHDEVVRGGQHHHEDWMVQEGADGEYCSACGEMVRSFWPEHQKLRKVADKSQAIGEFVEWLVSEKQIFLCREHLFEDASKPVLGPVFVPIQDLLAEFFGIDQKVLEEEKRDMLDRIRSSDGG